MKNNHASDWQPGTLKTPSEYSGRAFYALSRHFPSTFWIPKQNEYYRGDQKVLARCTSSPDLHMLIVPLWYLFRTLLVPKVALGYVYLPLACIWYWHKVTVLSSIESAIVSRKEATLEGMLIERGSLLTDLKDCRQESTCTQLIVLTMLADQEGLRVTPFAVVRQRVTCTSDKSHWCTLVSVLAVVFPREVWSDQSHWCK